MCSLNVMCKINFLRVLLIDSRVGSFSIDRVPCSRRVPCVCGGGRGGGGVGLLKNLCRDGQDASRNPYFISNQNMIFPYPISDRKSPQETNDKKNNYKRLNL